MKDNGVKQSGMRIKTYFVKSVDEAMSLARVELGSDALLLNTRRLMEGGKPNGYEVVMGVNPSAPVEEQVPAPAFKATVFKPPVLPPALPQPVLAKTAVPPPVLEKVSAPKALAQEAKVAPSIPEHAPVPAQVSSELKQLQAQMDDLREILLRTTRAQAIGGGVIPELGALYSRLLESQVDAVLAKDIVNRLEAAMATDAFFLETGRASTDAGSGAGRAANRWKVLRPAAEMVEKFLRAELQKRIKILPAIGVAEATLSPVTVLVGPTGGGKTTTVAKLAVAANAQAPIHVLSLDWSRPGASQQLQALAVGPKITFSAIHSLEGLPEVFSEARRDHCVLADTAGFAASEWGGAEELAEALARCEEIDVHLTVPGYMNAADLRRTLERYRIFKPSKLIVTKMDESESFGPAFSEAVRAGLSLSFVTDGPRIPDDIQSASLDELVALGRGRGAQRAA